MYSAPTEDELNQLLHTTSVNEMSRSYVTVNGHLLPRLYLSMEDSIRDFEVFDTDIWICAFPKTGTTWISEIAWIIANNFDYEGAKVFSYQRTIHLETSMLVEAKDGLPSEAKVMAVDSIVKARSQKHPRTIKSHFPFSLLPQQIVNGTRSPKIICTARNPMDTCVSYYHHGKNYDFYSGTFEEFCRLFLFGKVTYGPYPEHVLSFWEQRHKPNVLFVTYEEMKTDLAGVIGRVGEFLGKTVSEEDSRRLQEHVSFDSMKKNPSINKEELYKALEENRGKKLTPFIRSGKAGGYRNVMSSQTIEEFGYWIRKKFRGSGLDLLNV